MAAGKMTQTQLVRHLAKRCAVNRKVARTFLDEMAKVAVRETGKNASLHFPGASRSIKKNRTVRPGRFISAKRARDSAKTIPGKDPALEILTEVFSHL